MNGAYQVGPLSEAEVVLQALLVDLGVPVPEVERATIEGTLHLLALERLVSLEAAAYTLEQVADTTGIGAEQIRAYWRALGFPEPRPGEPVFSDTDLEMLSVVLPFIAEGGLDEAGTTQMARVIGSSLAKIATAQIEAIERAVSESTSDVVDDDRLDEDVLEAVEQGDAGLEALDPEVEADLVAAARRAAELLPMMPRLMEFVWRRHLGHAARRRIIRAATEEEVDDVCVGFADLVGFTAATQELPEDELAHVVDRFESIAYDCVAVHGGRVIKTIGDEVMFLTDSPKAGAELALDLAAAYRADPDLSDVRVGLAAGKVLERDGDVYGPVVNLASRIVAIAFPGSVVVGPNLHASLAEDEAFELKSIRSHYLKDIGRVRLWTMRRAGEHDDEADLRATSRRAARRRFILERRERRRADAVRRADEVAPDLAVGDLLDVLEVDEHVEDATTGEYEALTDAVLASDLDEETQVELLADIEAAKRLQDLEEQAEALAVEADAAAERRIAQIEEDARRRIEEIEADKRRQVEHVLSEAEQRAQKANEEASRRVKRVAEETERRAERAERDARRDAKRMAAKARSVREKAEAEREKAEAEREKADESSGDRRQGERRRLGRRSGDDADADGEA